MSKGIVFLVMPCLLSLFGYASTTSILEMQEVAHEGDTFELVGGISCLADYRFLLNDDTGGVLVSYFNDDPQNWRLGDIIKTTVRVKRIYPSRESIVFNVFAEDIKVIGHDSSILTPIDIQPGDMVRHDDLCYRKVRIHGSVTDAFRDELDPNFVYFILEKDCSRAIVSILNRELTDSDINKLIDADVSITGVYSPYADSGRLHTGPNVIDYTGSTLNILNPAAANPFEGSRATTFDVISVDKAARSGHRYHVTGRVIATWGSNNLFMLTDDGKRIRVQLNTSCSKPTVNSRITIAGFIRRDIFFVRVTNALYRTEPQTEAEPETPVTITPREMLTDSHNRQKIKHLFDGQIVTLSGKVTNIRATPNKQTYLTVEKDGIHIDIEFVGATPPPVNSIVNVTGACLFQEQRSRSNYDFPRLETFSILMRTQNDLHILVNPPWWTPFKLMVVIIILGIIIIAAIIWQIFLRKLIERMGRELTRESLAHIKAELRMDERTALAVELHDTIAQNLTGVTMQLEGVETAHRENSARLGELIGKARHALDSCCIELRNCLWDLRNDAFDSEDISATVRKAIAPHLQGAMANIALDLPRSRISDSTFHTLLCIIRELVINAVRHGRAGEISIRGELTKKALIITVKDNGCGFDPNNRPGPDQGHFGLLGIQERLDRIGGEFDMSSSPGNGAEFTITIES